MKSVSMIFMLAVLATTAAFFGCSQNHKDEGHIVYAPEGHTIYTIARQGALLRDENFDVVLVHGFNDNREIARQITDFLNMSEPNTYSYFEED